MSDVTVPAPTMSQFSAGTLMTSQEALVHVFVGAQFGDLEFDVGKSVRWTQWFSDDTFITDVNLGDPRYWIVNWSATFPQAHHTVTGINYFVLPTEFRKEQLAGASREPTILLEDNDWVLFVDACEGLCIDTRNPQPTDVNTALFRSYIYREIARANTAGKDRLVLPFYVFLRHGNLINAEYPSSAYSDGATGFTTAAGVMGTPYYLKVQGLTRLIKVSALRNPAFDWTLIDRPTTPDTGLNTAIVSYGYAHWNLQDIVPPRTTVEPLSAANDDGWRMRNLLSAVRPIPTLPFGTWQAPAADPTGLAGPWAPADINVPDPIQPQPVTPDPSLAGLLVGLYDNFLRLNYRDGVWYEGGALGNIPLAWNGTTWVPRDASPEDWHDTDNWLAPLQ